jgi:hypothetical protein
MGIFRIGFMNHLLRLTLNHCTVNLKSNLAWWSPPVISALGRVRQDDHQASLGYTVRLSLTHTHTHTNKENKKEKQLSSVENQVPATYSVYFRKLTLEPLVQCWRLTQRPLS